MEAWNGFKGTKWQRTPDVEDFILNNYTEYVGNSDFLKGISRKTTRLLSRVQKLLDKEEAAHLLDVDSLSLAGINHFDPGYVDKKNEIIVGLQTDEPLKHFINPYISLNTSLGVLKSNGYRFNHDVEESFREFQVSYEDAVNEVYTKEIKKFKEVHLIDGLPDTFGRGFIVSDYRRLPLYGADYLIKQKERDLERLRKDINYSVVRTREEVIKQIAALKALKQMASTYDIDVSKPASNAKEAFEWLYLAYLAGAKETYGVSLPTGNNSPFLDIYIERDIALQVLTEEEAQELVDQFLIKLRLLRYLRTPEYLSCFPGMAPIITETIGGMSGDHSMITKTSYRILNSLENIGAYEVPNYTILWSSRLPVNFKRYCIKMMLKFNCLQFLNADTLNSFEYASTGMAGLSKIGKQIDYYGGSCNLPKVLLYAINGGRDELTGEMVIGGIEPLTGKKLNYSEVVKNFVKVLKKVISIQDDALNVIHYMHDKYGYESSLMAFNDTVVERSMTFNLIGFANVIDSLSAIRFADVQVNRDENGLSTDFVIKDSFPRFGLGDVTVDKLASDTIKMISKELQSHHMYRNATIKMGIASSFLNVVCGTNTGATPDGRFKGAPFAFNANPISNIDNKSLINSLKSVMRLPSNLCQNGIVTTVNTTANTLGTKRNERANNMMVLLDSFFGQKGTHIEFNLIDKKVLLDAKDNDKKGSDIVLRSGGCAIRYKELSTQQQESLIDQTYHEVLQ